MNYYELMMVVAPQLDEEALTATLDRVNNYVSQRGGSVVRQERWGSVRRLAYPIKTYTEGSYVLTYVELKPQDASELESSIRVSEDVLRHLLLRVDAIPPARVETPPPAAAEAPPADAEPVAEVAAEAPSADAEPVAEVAAEAPLADAEPVAEVAAEAPSAEAEPVAEVAAEAPLADAEPDEADATPSDEEEQAKS